MSTDKDNDWVVGCLALTVLVAIICAAFVNVGLALVLFLIASIVGLVLKIKNNKKTSQNPQNSQPKQKSQIKKVPAAKSALYPTLTEDVFNRINKQVRALRQIYDEILMDHKVMQELHEVVGAKLRLSNREFSGVEDENRDTLKALFITDFGKLYYRMGYNLKFSACHIEQVILLMFTSAVFDEQVYKTFADVDKKARELLRYQVLTTDIYTQLKPLIDKDIVPGKFSVVHLAEHYRRDWKQRYIKALTELFAVMISDGFKPTEKELLGVSFLREMLENIENSGKKNKRGEAESELKSLIGLGSVKESIESLSNFIKIQQKRKVQGHKSMNLSYHCVFVGNPGTGKTTVARLLASIYKDLGVLKSGHLVEVDRSDLVGEYVGQTAIKTDKVIDSAIDGVLFIDEAYTLATGNNMDYGNEAIATLLKRMEDERERLVVILAGYPENMHHFIDSNPGLQSRFSRYIEFEDYSAEELEKIFELNVYKNDYKLSPEALQVLRDELSKAVINKDDKFGNARYVRNLFEHAIENQANRLASMSRVEDEKLSIIEAEDIPLA